MSPEFCIEKSHHTKTLKDTVYQSMDSRNQVSYSETLLARSLLIVPKRGLSIANSITTAVRVVMFANCLAD
jgi:hypothetical protein